MESTKQLNSYIEEKDDMFYPTCRFCGKQTLPDAPYLSQAEADEAATIRCDCFEARKYQEKTCKNKERADETKPSEIDILREALRLALSDKTYCRYCDLNTSCGSEECFKFRTDEVMKEAKKNLEKAKNE